MENHSVLEGCICDEEESEKENGEEGNESLQGSPPGLIRLQCAFHDGLNNRYN